MGIINKHNNRNGLFAENAKGDILIVGSGDFFRMQKAKYSQHTSPYKHLYADQVLAVCKDLPKEKCRILLNQAGKNRL
jgi:hypothetical protein